jgi:AraC-like DNA-binding protein
MKCTLCTQRKAKRSCPAKNWAICSQCCGEKRVLKLNCPESCDYLKAGRAQEARQASELFYRTSDPAEQAKRVRIVEEFEPVLSFVQTVIACERHANQNLTDADVAEALDCLLRTLRTEDRGIFYETTSNNLRADILRRQLSEAIQSFRNPTEADGGRLLLSQAIQCLELLRAMVGAYAEPGAIALSFVEFLARQVPRNALNMQAPSSIVIPG